MCKNEHTNQVVAQVTVAAESPVFEFNGHRTTCTISATTDSESVLDEISLLVQVHHALDELEQLLTGRTFSLSVSEVHRLDAERSL